MTLSTVLSRTLRETMKNSVTTTVVSCENIQLDANADDDAAAASDDDDD